MIATTTKNKILSIVSVFETSSLNPRYDILVVLNDGPHRKPQITFGKHQTTEYGNLKVLLQMYDAVGGLYAKEFKQYLPLIGIKPLSNNETFKYWLKQAGKDPVMIRVQDKFFDQMYWAPAEKFFNDNKFTLPLSMAVIYDSYIHSGSIPAWLRDDFSEVPPAKGGDEKAWITAYVNTRDYWLEHHSNKILNNTDYRTDTWKDCIAANDWQLLKPVVCKFNSSVPSKWITIP
jgi:chitosanase